MYKRQLRRLRLLKLPSYRVPWILSLHQPIGLSSSVFLCTVCTERLNSSPAATCRFQCHFLHRSLRNRIDFVFCASRSILSQSLRNSLREQTERLGLRPYRRPPVVVVVVVILFQKSVYTRDIVVASKNAEDQREIVFKKKASDG